ncbi:hemolysin family protein [Kitasatospora viridis]|uniref:CBS domain containing-hemolysin-like protein n=1 Tax=Kitasatospora viridis TaxID=281105 RepID=A0A561SF40_9ACTN|nr:hemolysin family protein [Kitasatospora viridis]TWF73479.1 CBS domain containing-hemolysin-like protein [Kitasatospora viridis]
MTTAWLLLAAALLLILANGLFVAAEFSFVTVDRGAVDRAARDGDRRAHGLRQALRSLSFQLSGAQLGITITSLVVGMLAEPALAVLLTSPLTDLDLSEGTARGLSAVVGMLVATVLQMVIGELVPKNWAISRPLQVARAVAAPQRLFSAACGPLIRVLNGCANRLVRALGVEPTEELEHARTPDELAFLARHSAQAGAMEQDAALLFVRTLNLGGLTAESVMTPRVEVAALGQDATAADVVNLTRATGFSRFPVYRDSLDDITGTVTLKDALGVRADLRAEVTVGRLAADPLLVPETLSAEQLLEQLRRRQPMAIVIDEYGGTAGVATLEDIVEEIVGEVRDEHDPGESPELLAVPPVAGHPAWLADGRARIDQLAGIGLHAPHGPYETLAGLLADLLGRIPERGDTATLPGWELTVQGVDRHRTTSVRLVHLGETA